MSENRLATIVAILTEPARVILLKKTAYLFISLPSSKYPTIQATTSTAAIANDEPSISSDLK
jgi:hypothetical protein